MKISNPMQEALRELYRLGGQAALFPGKGRTAEALEKRGLIAWTAQPGATDQRVYLTEAGYALASGDLATADAAPAALSSVFAGFTVTTRRIPNEPRTASAAEVRAYTCNHGGYEPDALAVWLVTTGEWHTIDAEEAAESRGQFRKGDRVVINDSTYAMCDPCRIATVQAKHWDSCYVDVQPLETDAWLPTCPMGYSELTCGEECGERGTHAYRPEVAQRVQAALDGAEANGSTR